MAKETGIQLYNKVLGVALQVPGVKVNREAFLRNTFSDFCTPEQLDLIVKDNPRAHLEIELLDQVAKNVISRARKEVTSISALSGIPGNPFAAAGLAVADMGQYMGFCMNVSQKLAYVYGFPDMLKDGELSDNSKNILTALIGVMFGVQQSVKVINYISKALAVQVAKRLPTIAFGHAAWYVFIKQIAKWIGIRMSKQSFAKTVSKIIPFVGAGISGGITYATFGPAANKLAQQLRFNSKFFKDVEHTATTVVEDAEYQEMDK